MGLASALCLSRRYPELKITLVEKENLVAQHQTGRNSGVMHSGVYYQPGSLKAKFCVEGLAKMVDFAEDHGVPYERCGKVIVASHEQQLPRLQALLERGGSNGIAGLEILDPKGVREREPHVKALGGLFVPSTGIINYQRVAEKMAELLCQNPKHRKILGETVQACRPGGQQLLLETNKRRLLCQRVVNCSGLQGDRIARLSGAKPQLRIVPFRGDYYELSPEARFRVKHLVYPVPNPAFPFLGVHFTRMIEGGVECGPNAVFSFRREGYSKFAFDLADSINSLSYLGTWRLFRRHWSQGLCEMMRAFSKRRFLASLQEMIPDLGMEDIRPCRSGVRAVALNGDGSFCDDFHFLERDGVLHVLNTPSPAATSSLSIGEAVAERLGSSLEGA